MVASQMMAAPQMGLAPRRGRSHEHSFSAAPDTSSSKSHTKIWVFHCQLLLLTSTVWSRIAACETTMKTMALKHPGKKDCGCSGVLVACCSLVLWLFFFFFRGEGDVWELFSSEVTSQFFRIAPTPKIKPIVPFDIVPLWWDNIKTQVYSLLFLYSQISPCSPKKAIKINSDSKKKKSALTMQFPSKTCGQCLECHWWGQEEPSGDHCWHPHPAEKAPTSP